MSVCGVRYNVRYVVVIIGMRSLRIRDNRGAVYCDMFRQNGVLSFSARQVGVRIIYFSRRKSYLLVCPEGTHVHDLGCTGCHPLPQSRDRTWTTVRSLINAFHVVITQLGAEVSKADLWLRLKNRS